MNDAMWQRGRKKSHWKKRTGKQTMNFLQGVRKFGGDSVKQKNRTAGRGPPGTTGNTEATNFKKRGKGKISRKKTVRKTGKV